MEQQEARAKGEDVDTKVESKEVEAILSEAAKIDWDISSRAAIRDSVKALAEILVKHGLDDPSQEKVGGVVSANREQSLDTIVKECVKQFGYAAQKAKKAAKKKENTEKAVKCKANANIVGAFKELAELYAKTGNGNAASSYFRVVNALTELEFEITAENALSLGKGKTKVHNIGKASAEKMLEFLTTGTMEKLEQKRLEAAD